VWHLDPLGALDVRAFAHAAEALGLELEPLDELLDPVVHLAEEGLVSRGAFALVVYVVGRHGSPSLADGTSREETAGMRQWRCRAG
jgi:hypothetical protein